MNFRWLLTAGCLAFSLALLSGCSEPIATYEVPYVKKRLLGAMVFHGPDVWFFKLMGNADDVARQKDAFTKFIKSIRFPAEGKEPIAWTVPDGWEHDAGKGMRFATFNLPRQMQVTVFRFGSEAGSVLPNVNRWRDQLKLPPISGRELLDIGKREKLADEVEALLVDMEGARYAPVAPEPADEPLPPSDKPLDYKAPSSWTSKANPGAMAVAAFTVEAGGKSAEVTIIPLSGGGGSIDANINRWRGQVDLPPADTAQLRKDATVIKVNGEDSILVDLKGPKGKSILAAICPGGNRTWFVKMMGDAELVAQQRADFEAFLATLRFGGED